jgi:tetratricopeptide (TPR) repeat protein
MPRRLSIAWPAAAVLVMLGLASWSWVALRPAPRFDRSEFDRLTSLGRFDDAQRLLASHLEEAPDDARAHYLRAQLMLERPDRSDVAFTSDELATIDQSLARLARADPGGRIVPCAIQALYRGKALYQQKRWQAAEESWHAALALDPLVPEAGWSLLGLYYLQGRRLEARRLALQLIKVETDPRDRAQLLLELVRQDAIRPDSASLVRQFEPVVAAEPGGITNAIALGHTLIRSGETERGLAVLESLRDAHPGREDVWEGWLSGLETASVDDRLVEEASRVPDVLAASPRLARFRALAAQHRGDWPEAVRECERGVERDPTDFGTLVRLARALRFAGDAARADACDDRVQAYRKAQAGLLAFYDEADQVKSLGVAPHVELCERLALAREAMGRPDEAILWRVVGNGAESAVANRQLQ